MRKKIEICMLHNSIRCVDDINRYFQIDNNVNLPFYFAYNTENPNYLVATEQIYTDIKIWNRFVELSKRAQILIYRSLECTVGDLNIFDYYIGFDKKLRCGDRVGRTPTRLYYSNLIHRMNNDIISIAQAKELLASKKEFCNFIYSNPHGHPYRTQLFYDISEYKQVDALGGYLKNKSVESIQYGNNWSKAISESVELKSPYKFSIACENAMYEGYTSEKIFSSLEAHTVPIYWGNPDIENEVNSQAFINCFKYRSKQEMLSKIKQIDEDDDLWCEMIIQPWLTGQQIEDEQVEVQKYYDFISNIFMQPLDLAVRKAEGFHPERYKKWFYSNEIEIQDTINDRLKSKWLDMIYGQRKCGDYFIKNGYNTIGIYGAGKNCELFLEDLKNGNIEVKYILDKYKRGYFHNIIIEEPMNVKNLSCVDVIVVSLPYLFEEVYNMLSSLAKCKIVSIEEVVEG